MHQPAGILLLMWPCWLGVAVASPAYPYDILLAYEECGFLQASSEQYISAWGWIGGHAQNKKDIPTALLKCDRYTLFLWFLLGAVIMRGAGCIINDLADRNLDAQVERTKNRPLASRMVSIPEALTLLCALLGLGLFVLSRFNLLAIMVGITAVIPMIIYPFMKRLTDWPQLFLGITFNMGALMGYAAVTNSLPAQAFYLYLSLIFWTLSYDTVYALQDREDDIKAGIKSTAILFGGRVREAIGIFYAVFLIIFTGAAMTGGYGLTFMGCAAMLGLIFMWKVKTLNISDKESCMNRFKANAIIGFLLFLTLLFTKGQLY